MYYDGAEVWKGGDFASLSAGGAGIGPIDNKSQVVFTETLGTPVEGGEGPNCIVHLDDVSNVGEPGIEPFYNGWRWCCNHYFEC